MALISCNCSIKIEKDDHGYSQRSYSIFINNGGSQPSSNEANDLDFDDLKLLESELSKSIQLEKQMNDAH